jgi:hypothetical protein
MSQLQVNRINDTSGGVLAPISSVMRNRIINGAMTIDQRNAGASVTPAASVFTLDRWAADMTQASKFSVEQTITGVAAPVGFTDYLGVTSTSAYSVLTGDTFLIRQIIEGFNIADLGWGTANAKTVTLSFWVRSSLTGTFGGALVNGAATFRSYPFSYTISSANTWEQKSITIVGDTTGTWATNNTSGLSVRFGLGSGATFTGTAGAWTAGNLVQPTGSVSIVGTNGATFYITGVQLEKGTQATSFEYRQYGTELALCQRYFCKSSSTNVVATNNSVLVTGMFSSGVVNTYGSNAAYSNWIKYPVTMRTDATTITFINTSLPLPGTSGQWSVYNGSAWINTSSVNGQASTAEGFNTALAFTGTAYMYYGAWTASAEL